MKLKFATALALPLLLLAACEDEADEAGNVETGGEAAGEVLGGTISDDMLPLEQLTSTSPPAEPTATPGGAGSGSEEGEGDAPDTTEAEAPEEAPAPEPADEE